MPGATHTAEDWLAAIAHGTSDDPFGVLGPHETTVDGRRAVVVRTMQPSASHVDLVGPTGGQNVPTARRHADGLFEQTVPYQGEHHPFDYRHSDYHPTIASQHIHDPYRY